MLRAVNIAWRTRRPLADVRSWVGGSLLDTLRRAGYDVESTTETAATGLAAEPGTEWILSKKIRPTFWLLFSVWAWLASMNTYWAVLTLSQLADGRTELLVAGDLPGPIAKILCTLAAPAPAVRA